MDERNKAVVADGEFRFEDSAAVLGRSLRLDGAIRRVKINNRAAHAGFHSRHVNERARATRGFGAHGESPHFNDWAREFREAEVENSLVKSFRAVHLLHVNLKPADNIMFLHNLA